ncbi:hypothetical protein HNP10_000031 [Aeromonas veronii]|nr:hypothetical protein [Aeromonas veronii]
MYFLLIYGNPCFKQYIGRLSIKVYLLLVITFH